MVTRTEVQGMQQIQAGQTSRSAQVVKRATEVPLDATQPYKRTERILSALGEFVDTASEAAYRQAQIDVEKRKIDGMATAVSGGQLGEEATKAEQMGYDLVQSQSELGVINERLADAVTNNPEMSDEEFKKLRDDEYGGLLAKYQDRDQDVFKAISVKAQESQLTLHSVRTQAQQKYREFKAEETLNYNINSQLDSAKTVEQGVGLVHQYMAQGRAMGLSEPKIKDMLYQSMKLTAANGDARLLKFIQSTDWGKYAPDTQQASALYKSYVKQAQAEYEAAMQKQNVLAYGQMFAQLEEAAKSGMPKEQLMAMMQSMQGQGVKFSPATVANYLTMGSTMSKAQMELQSNIGVWQENKGNFNLATNPFIATEDKNKVLDAAESAVVQAANDVPEEQRGDFVISNLIRLSKQEGMPIKTIGTALSSLTTIDPQAPMTPAVQNWAKFLIASDDQTIRMNVSSEQDQALLFGMRDVLINAQGQDGELMMKTAISRGQQIRDNKTPLTTQQTTSLKSKVRSNVSDFEDPTQTTWYFTTKGMPSSAKDYVTSQISSRAQKLYSVTGDVDKAVELATKEFKNNSMILSGGVVANIGVNQLSAYVPELTQKGDDAAMVQKRAVSALDTQLGKILKEQSEADGLEYKRGDAQFIFSNSGQTYQVNVGGVTVGTYFTKDIKQYYDEASSLKFIEEQDTQIRKSMEARTPETSLPYYNPRVY